jgi:hypothetical protein
MPCKKLSQVTLIAFFYGSFETKSPAHLTPMWVVAIYRRLHLLFAIKYNRNNFNISSIERGFMTHIELHNEAEKRTKSYQASEKDLIDILERIRNQEAYRKLGYSTFWNYLTLALKLSDSEAGRFNSVIRVVSQVPVVKEAIQKGELSISKISRMASVVTNTNASSWVEKAKLCTFRELEREVKKANPESCKQEKITPKSEELSRLSIPLSKEAEENLKRVKEILSKKRQRIVSYEECILEMSHLYLEKYDPLKKQIKHPSTQTREVSNKTQFSNTTKPKQQAREKLSTWELRTVMQRDNAQCVGIQPDGSRCLEKSFTHIHHKIPVSHGGTNHPNNLEVLCFWHHQMTHEKLA